MIEFLRKAPFIKFILAFSAGVIIRLFSEHTVYNYPLLFSITFIVWFGLILMNKFYIKLKHHWLWGIGVSTCFIITGFTICCLQYEKFGTQYLPENKKIAIKGIIDDTPQECSKTFKYQLNVELYKSDSSVYSFKKKILLYLPKDSASGLLKKGDVVVAFVKCNRLKSLRGSKFDYAGYMFKQGIIFSAYAAKTKWHKTDSMKMGAIDRMGEYCKNKLLGLFKKAGFKGRNFNVVSALTIGYKSDLDKETKQAYISSGTMHILAVSGLHVGIIYLVLNLLLSFLDKKPFLKSIKSLLIILIISFYAFLTGLSPSILRAALMLYMICLSQIFNRPSFIYNAISISAFILFLYNPLQITDAGFQLSYAAVISIVVIYPILYKLFQFKSYTPDKIWQLIAVSIAAQIGTFPISLYYFNQFPTFFLLSNLLIIPISTFAMYMAFILIVVAYIPVLFQLSGKLLYALVDLQNNTVLWIEHLPFSSIKGIPISFAGIFFCYLLITSIILFLLKKKTIYAFGILISILIWQWFDIVSIVKN